MLLSWWPRQFISWWPKTSSEAADALRIRCSNSHGGWDMAKTGPLQLGSRWQQSSWTNHQHDDFTPELISLWRYENLLWKRHRHVVQEQEAQTLFPTDHRAPLSPTCCFFYLLNIANSSWVVSFLQKYWACWSSYWLECHSLSCSEQPSPTPRARSSQQAHPNKAEICSWAGHLWLPCESMESQSILLMESTVIHLFLKEMLKTEQMNGIINPLISPCCLESPVWQPAHASLLCKYLEWVDPNPSQPSPALVPSASQAFGDAALPVPCRAQRFTAEGCHSREADPNSGNWNIPALSNSSQPLCAPKTPKPPVPCMSQSHSTVWAGIASALGVWQCRAPHRLYKLLMTKDPGLVEHVQHGKS